MSRNIENINNKITAIHACLTQLTKRSPDHSYIFLSDSLSSLTSLQDPYTNNNTITQGMHVVLHTLSSIKTTVTFIWIPGHVGYPLHDSVGRVAKNATHLSEITILPHHLYMILEISTGLTSPSGKVNHTRNLKQSNPNPSSGLHETDIPPRRSHPFSPHPTHSSSPPPRSPRLTFMELLPYLSPSLMSCPP